MQHTVQPTSDAQYSILQKKKNVLQWQVTDVTGQSYNWCKGYDGLLDSH